MQQVSLVSHQQDHEGAKPDITAPGVDIVAAYTATLGGPEATAMENGTSMSSPHIAGSAALLRAVQPLRSPVEVRSAINLTARTAGLIEANGSPVDAWDLGSGRVDLTRAALSGFVLDESNANSLASNPSPGGDLSTLNLAAFASADCASTCTFTGTLRSTTLVSHAYAATVAGMPDGSVVLSRATFTIDAGATQVITITVDATQLTAGWNFEQVDFAGDDVLLPALHMPMAINA